MQPCVRGRCSSGGRAFSADRSEAESTTSGGRAFSADRSEAEIEPVRIRLACNRALEGARLRWSLSSADRAEGEIRTPVRGRYAREKIRRYAFAYLLIFPRALEDSNPRPFGP